MKSPRRVFSHLAELGREVDLDPAQRVNATRVLILSR